MENPTDGRNRRSLGSEYEAPSLGGGGNERSHLPEAPRRAVTETVKNEQDMPESQEAHC